MAQRSDVNISKITQNSLARGFVEIHGVAHHCCDPCCATQCRTHNVAPNSRNFQDVAGMSSCISHAPQKRPCRTYLATPLSLCRREICLQKRIALHGGVAATLTQIALHCATKETHDAKNNKETDNKIWKCTVCFEMVTDLIQND